MSERIESALLDIQDVAQTVRDRLSSMSFSQDRLDELHARLALIQRLKKKYGPTLEAVLEFQNQTEAKLEATKAGDDRSQELRREIADKESHVRRAADELTRSRNDAARRLETLVAQRLSHLGMPHVVFTIAIEPRERSIHGADHIDFLFSANLGEPLRSLREIASGGELSRVMLAVKTVLAESDDVETLVFDEVDAGIGGSVALAVGDQMAELSKSRQVIAITHLASIAAKADHHMVVRKETDSGRTYTRIAEVKGSERVSELARMLGGKAAMRLLSHTRARCSARHLSPLAGKVQGDLQPLDDIQGQRSPVVLAQRSHDVCMHRLLGEGDGGLYSLRTGDIEHLEQIGTALVGEPLADDPLGDTVELGGKYCAHDLYLMLPSLAPDELKQV
jgi:DNA repair protein RecN (Recombination protein N)